VGDRIVLVCPTHQNIGFTNATRQYAIKRIPPLGLMYLSSTLRAKGYRTSLLDLTIDAIPPERLYDEAVAADTLFLGFYSTLVNAPVVLEYVRAVKDREPDLTVVVGGPSSMEPHQFLEAGVDVVVQGEGERTVVELAEAIASGTDVTGMKGTAVLRKGTVVTGPPREQIAELDELPFPDRAFTDPDNYYDYFNVTSNQPFTSIICSRGCPNRCAYCTSPSFWGRPRYRSVDNVREEIVMLHETMGIKYLDIVDDTFNADPAWLDRFLDMMIGLDLGIEWSCNLFPFKRDPPLKKMRRAGCTTLKLGVQSACPEVLKEIHRSPDSAEACQRIVTQAKGLGYLTFLDVIFGLPGESPATIERNMAYTYDVDATITKYYRHLMLEGSELSTRAVGGELCDLSSEEIDDFVDAAWRTFYLRPGKVAEVMTWFLSRPRAYTRLGAYLAAFRGLGLLGVKE